MITPFDFILTSRHRPLQPPLSHYLTAVVQDFMTFAARDDQKKGEKKCLQEAIEDDLERHEEEVLRALDEDLPSDSE